jgi:hypothetical protein
MRRSSEVGVQTPPYNNNSDNVSKPLETASVLDVDDAVSRDVSFDLILEEASLLDSVKSFLGKKRNLAVLGTILGVSVILIVGISLLSSPGKAAKTEEEKPKVSVQEKAAPPSASKEAPVPPAPAPASEALPQVEASTPTAVWEPPVLETSYPQAAEQNPVAPTAPVPSTPIETAAIIPATVSEIKAAEPAEQAAEKVAPLNEKVLSEAHAEHSKAESTTKIENSSKTESVAKTEKGPQADIPSTSESNSVKMYNSLFGGGAQDLPITISREDVQAGMSGVAGRVKKCGKKKETRPIVMAVTIGRSGKVIDAAATGTFAGTEVGNCVTSVVLSARFPKAQKDTNVKYPFQF